MSSEELNEREELFIDLGDRSTDNSISDRLKELKSSGKLKINLEIKLSSGLENKNLELETDLFSKIKEIQDLPDWVIVKLILAAGQLKSSSFNERVPNG